MRYLLVAHDFPPIPSPQALRWAYLSRELALAGNEMHVLAPDVDGYGPDTGLVQLPGVAIHRCDAGLFTGFLVRRRRARVAESIGVGGATSALTQSSRAQPARGPGPEGLNWKGLLFERANRIASALYFPDLRAEWIRPARRALDQLLDELQPDIVISSHEPAVSIPLGLHAKRRGYHWIADLGDPVLAPYTPARWRRHAFRLERRLCQQADLVTVTTDKALKTLMQRHCVGAERTMLLTQGFDHRIRDEECASPLEFDSGGLELVYTGSFYTFRDPVPLLEAIASVPGVRLTVASIKVPPFMIEAAERMPNAIRLAGFVGHRQSLAMQRKCDLLVNIANNDPIQIPGKLYEYLGARTRILSIGDLPDSASGCLLLGLNAGRIVPNVASEIAGLLAELVHHKRTHGRIPRRNASHAESVYSWQSIAQRMQRRCEHIASRGET